jgi:hypothetical protein
VPRAGRRAEPAAFAQLLGTGGGLARTVHLVGEGGDQAVPDQLQLAAVIQQALGPQVRDEPRAVAYGHPQLCALLLVDHSVPP